MARSSSLSVVACLAAVALAGLVYLNSLHNPFVYDDIPSVVTNQSLTNPTLRAVVMQNISRPLVNVSYVIDHAIWGRDPFGFHLTGLLLHMLNVTLLFVLARGLALDEWRHGSVEEDRQATLAAAVTATLFAVHPMMTEAVGYVSGRSDLLSGTFMLLSFVALRKWLNTNRSMWLALVPAAFFVALAAKETTVILPVLFLYYILFVRDDLPADRRRQVLLLCVPILATAIVAASVRLGLFVFVEYAGIAGWQGRYALTEIDVFTRYVAMMIAPVGQAIFHGVPVTRSVLDPRAIVALAMLSIYIVLCVMAARRQSSTGLGLAWFLLMLLPSALLILLNRGEAMAERRVYFASAGLFIAAGRGAAAVAETLQFASRFTRTIAATVALVVIAGLAGRTVLRNFVWSSPVLLWAEAVGRNPGYWYPQLVLGESLHAAGRHDEAIPVFQEALKLAPGVDVLYENLGLCQVERRRFDEAVLTFTALWTINPKSVAATQGLAMAALLHGSLDDARLGFLRSLEVDPRRIEARRGLVVVEDRAGRPEDARAHCEEIERLAPGSPVPECSAHHQR